MLHCCHLAADPFIPLTTEEKAKVTLCPWRARQRRAAVRAAPSSRGCIRPPGATASTETTTSRSDAALGRGDGAVARCQAIRRNIGREKREPTFRPSLAWQLTLSGVSRLISFSSLPLLPGHQHHSLTAGNTHTHSHTASDCNHSVQAAS